jgi:hypothetical protein
MQRSFTSCGYTDCRLKIAAQPGQFGVFISAHDNKSLICTNCRTREALSLADRPVSLLRPVLTLKK